MLIDKKKKQEQKKQELKAKAEQLIHKKSVRIGAAVCCVLLLAFAGIRFMNRDSLLREGIAYCEKKEYAKAQTSLKNAILADNLKADNYTYLGIAYLGDEKYADAEKQFRLALNLDPENVSAYRGLGISAFKTGDYERAITELNHALDHTGIWLNQEIYDILWYRADAEKALKDYEAACETYGILIELEGDTAVTRYNRGAMYCLLDKKEEAMADFDAALAKKGNGYPIFWNIYDSMADAGWVEEAEAYLKLSQEPGYIDLNHAGTETEVNKYRGMIAYICRDYETAVSLLSSTALSSDKQAQIYLALSYEQQQEKDKALAVFLEQVNAANADAEDYNRLARFYIRSEQGEQAVEYLQKGIEKFPQSDLQDLYYNMVSAYESYGAYEDALDALKKYTRLYGEDDGAVREKAFLKERI